MFRHIVSEPHAFTNQGSLSEVFVGLELIAASNPRRSPRLYYWHREERSSNAEVDYVLQKGDKVVPIEVKSGTGGRIRSLRAFMAERGLDMGYRLSHENFGLFDRILNVPVYAAGGILDDSV